MTVGINTEVARYLANEEIETRTLLVIETEDETYRFIADDDNSSVEIGGETYLSASISLGTREENSDGSVESIEVTLSNKWQSWAAILANKGNTFLGQECRIYQWFPSYPDEPPVSIYHGILDEIKMTASEFKASVVRVLGDYEQEAPLMVYQVNCQYVFKGERCGYIGTEFDNCGKTLTECKARGRILNFGGFPSVPEEFLINKE